MVVIDSGSTATRERVYKVLSELQSTPPQLYGLVLERLPYFVSSLKQ